MSYKKIEDLITKDFLNDDPITDDGDFLTASASDMTGLTPTVAHDEEEAQSYEEVFPYLPPIRPIPGGGVVPDPAEGIHAEYRTHVSSQKHEENMK